MTIVLRRALVAPALAGLVALALVSAGAPSATAGSGSKGASGGKAVAHKQGGKKIRSAAVKRKAPTSKLFKIGMPSGEPTIGVTRSGAVFTSAIQSNTRVEVLRSKNGGKKWEVVSPTLPNGRNAQLLTLDPYTYVDNPVRDRDTSRMFTIDLTVACAYLSYSDDDGKSWVTNPLICGRPVNDHQTLFAGPPVDSPTVGYPNILYYCWNDIATSSCQKSLDGGLTFTATGTPAFPGVDPEAGGFCGGLHGHGYVDHKGTVYIPKGHCGQPWLSMSKDEGRTWERVQVAKNGVADHEAGVAVDRRGNIFYTYIGRDRLPYLAVSRNGGKKWSKPMMIGSPGVNEANIPSIDVGGPGKVAIAYMGTENGPGKPFPNDGYARTTWNGYITTTANALAKNPTFYSATVNNKRDPLKRARCGPGRCGTAIYDFIDVIIDLEGRVWSAWVDACVAICVSAGAGDAGNEGIVGRLVGGPKMR